MENATKALLISAAVLIVIILIALGVMLLRNSSGTSKHADEVGKEISHATEDTITNIQMENTTPIDKETFDKIIKQYEGTVNNEDKAYENIKDMVRQIKRLNDYEQPQIIVKIKNQNGFEIATYTNLDFIENDLQGAINSMKSKQNVAYSFRGSTINSDGENVEVTIQYRIISIKGPGGKR